MSKFLRNYFLMEENNGDGGDLGAAPAADTPAVPAEQSNANVDTPAEIKTDTANLGGNMFDESEENPATDDPEKKAEETKKTDDAEYDAEKAYSEFKYELPEGYSLTEEKQKEFIDMAKAQGVKPEQLQVFVNKHIEAQDAGVNSYKEMVKGWENEVKADPNLGGENFAATKKNVNSACSIDGGKEFRDVLASTGLISNPAVVKYLNKLGTMINSDNLVQGGQPKKDHSQDVKSIYDKSGY